MGNEHTSAESLEPLCHHLLSMLPSYALGTASADEARAVEALLPLCPDAQVALDDYRLIGDTLLTLSPLNEAPPPVEALLRRLPMKTPAHHAAQKQPKHAVHTLPVAAAPQPGPATHLRQPNGAAKIHSAPERRGPMTANPKPVFQRASAQRGGLGVGAAVAACAALLFVGSQVFWALQIDGLRREQQASLATYTEAITQTLGERLETVANPGLAGADAWVLNTANHHRALLPAESNAEAAKASFVWNSDDQIGALVVTGLPVLETEETYQLWLVRGEGQSLSLGTFELDASGVGVLIFQAAQPIEDYSHIGVSIEPEGGTSMPTTPHLIVGNI
ncbi:MAG: anti-sigma factor [Pleurocapsa minor GSE-CHR-MK-17-07R]|jgi:anti-sigma-K factor RskA|nr:anti-sigma factor [Pleurocapsa minor GSE-CHR-MK 17-07R]